MTIDRALRITVIFQVMSSALALALAGSETLLSGVAMIAICAMAYLVKSPWPVHFKTRKALWNVLAVAFLALFIFEISVYRVLLPAVVRLVVFLTSYKMFNINANRDYFTVFMLSFLQLLAAASISYDYLFAIPYVMYVIFSALAMILHTLKSGREREINTKRLLAGLPPIDHTPPAPVGRLPGAISVALFVLMLTILIFPLLPRFRTDVMATGKMDPVFDVSGFSETVNLEALSDIKTSSQIVMRVTMDAEDAVLAKRPKLRGITLSRFDGNRWRHSFLGGRAINKSKDGYFRIGDRPARHHFKQEIVLHPLNTRVVFSSGVSERMRGPFGRLYVDRMGSVFSARRNIREYRYSTTAAYSDFTMQELSGIQTPDFSPDIAPYLQLPTNSVFTAQDQTTIANITRQITENSVDQYQAVKAIETWLKSNFSYTLEIGQYRRDRNKILSFLTQRRRGHCEYFASTMVVMARSINVPARIVNGFQLGQYNPIGRFFTVRAADAHSWVEIYFPGRGWVEFDPTPASGQQSEFAETNPDFISGLLESMDMVWTQYVLSFDALDQQDLWDSIANISRNSISVVNALTDTLLALIPNLETGTWPHLVLRVFVQLLILVVVCILLWRLLIKPLWIKLRGLQIRQNRESIPFFEYTISLLRKNGYKISPTVTVREFANSIEDNTMRNLVLDITGNYEVIRFSEDDQLARRAHEIGKRKTSLLKMLLENKANE